MFWNRQLKRDVEYLKGRYETVYKDIKRLSDRIDKLERIIKRSGDEPSFDFSWFNQYMQSRFTLYLYINHEEYVIHLSELDNLIVTRDRCMLRVVGDIAYFSVVNQHRDNEIMTFAIEYGKGNYICTREGSDADYIYGEGNDE